MTDKRLLIRDESEQSHIYRVKQKETVTKKQRVQGLISRACGGPTEKLAMQTFVFKEGDCS